MVLPSLAQVQTTKGHLELLDPHQRKRRVLAKLQTKSAGGMVNSAWIMKAFVTEGWKTMGHSRSPCSPYLVWEETWIVQHFELLLGRTRALVGY